jgi:hypothetical protein
MQRIMSVGSILFLIGLMPTARAADAAWTCMKDGKAIEVKGDTAKDKKKACDAAKGEWTKSKSKESHSGGGGW